MPDSTRFRLYIAPLALALALCTTACGDDEPAGGANGDATTIDSGTTGDATANFGDLASGDAGDPDATGSDVASDAAQDATGSDTSPPTDGSADDASDDLLADQGGDDVLRDMAPPPPCGGDFSRCVALQVQETTGIGRVDEVVTTGIPIPRDLDLINTDDFAVIGPDDNPVPAEFRILARWHAPLDQTTAPIQWLLVSFLTDISADVTDTYWLSVDGSDENPAPESTLTVTEGGGAITIDTGVVEFVLGADPNQLFDSASRGDTEVISGGSMMTLVGGINYTHTSQRSLRIVHQGPLTATVIVEGAFSMDPVGDSPAGRLGTILRYTFRAGSPTAIVRQVVNWEGSRCGVDIVDCGEEVNGLQIDRLRNLLEVEVGANPNTLANATEGETVRANAWESGETASVRQLQRSSRQGNASFSMQVPGEGSQSFMGNADRSFVGISGDAGAVAIAFNHMHRYEPLALRVQSDGNLALDLVDDHVWLANRQGLFTTFAVSVHGPEVAAQAVLSQTWAPLNYPLRAWPSDSWFRHSGAVDALPVGALTDDLDDYDRFLTAMVESTDSNIDNRGLAGLMTFGVYPRYWVDNLRSDELDCGDDDPTPENDWDDVFWCTTWTDYHNTVNAVNVWAMRSGEVSWLDDLAVPAALRTLHTQILQCAPGDNNSACGQARTGYGAYRTDNNASHAYFDNLFFYYWMTGDELVLDILTRGADSMRTYWCPTRDDGVCGPTVAPTDQWAGLAGRVASQWIAVYRFVGLASDDGSFLEDYVGSLARAVTQYYVQGSFEDQTYGFWLGQPVGDAGSYESDQLWMASLYDMNNLYRLLSDTNDAPIGDPAIRPSDVITGWARTLDRFGRTALQGAGGTAAGDWPNALSFTFSGGRLDATISGVTAVEGGDDPLLYDTGKATLTAVILRAARLADDAGLQALGETLVSQTLSSISPTMPLGKIQGLFWSRLHTAVALMFER